MKYRVLHIIPDLGPGGAERMASTLAARTDRSKFEVMVTSLYDEADTDLPQYLREARIPVYYLGKTRGLDMRMYSRIDKVLRAVSPDIVHTHRYVLKYALPSLVRSRVRVVHTVHTVAEQEVDWTGRLAHRIAFRLRIATPVAISEEVSRSLARVYGIAKCPLIPNGIPVEKYRKSDTSRAGWRKAEGFSASDFLITCVARLSEPKDHPTLIRAFADIARHRSHVYLLLVGTGRERPLLEELARDIGVGEQVRFLGFRTDVAEILSASDVFALISNQEGHPLSLMEAMAAGLPIVATAVGGVPELVENGRTGFLIAPGDQDMLSKTLTQLLTDKSLRERLGTAAREKAKDCDINAMIRCYETLYLALIQSR